MAIFPVNIGAANRGSQRLLDNIRSGRVLYAWIPTFEWRVRVDIRDVTFDEDTSTAVDLNALFPSTPFPTGVIRMMPIMTLREVFAGGAVSACTCALGDAGVPTGLITAQNVFTGQSLGIKQVGGAEYANRYEAAFAPTLTVATTTANGTALTTGIIDVAIQFAPVTAEMQ